MSFVWHFLKIGLGHGRGHGRLLWCGLGRGRGVINQSNNINLNATKTKEFKVTYKLADAANQSVSNPVSERCPKLK